MCKKKKTMIKYFIPINSIRFQFVLGHFLIFKNTKHSVLFFICHLDTRLLVWKCHNLEKKKSYSYWSFCFCHSCVLFWKSAGNSLLLIIFIFPTESSFSFFVEMILNQHNLMPNSSLTVTNYRPQNDEQMCKCLKEDVELIDFAIKVSRKYSMRDLRVCMGEKHHRFQNSFCRILQHDGFIMK